MNFGFVYQSHICFESPLKGRLKTNNTGRSEGDSMFNNAEYCCNHQVSRRRFKFYSSMHRLLNGQTQKQKHRIRFRCGGTKIARSSDNYF